MAESVVRAANILVADDELDPEVDSASGADARSKFVHDYQNDRFRFSFLSSYDARTHRFDPDKVLKELSRKRAGADALLLDVVFGSDLEFGPRLIPALLRQFPDLPVVMMTGMPRTSLQKRAIELGAVDYIVKPEKTAPDVRDTRDALYRALHRFVGVKVGGWLIGQSSAFLQTLDLAARASEAGSSSIFITGESGTGKELLAQYIHRHGPRHNRPFTVLHIPSMNPELLESRLFGHSKGAFTGASNESDGEFVKANGGIIFLDEVANISRDVQARLLRVTENGEVARAGDGRTRVVDVQIVSATNANIARRVKNGLFRADLWARLSVMPLTLPNLRERADDVAELANHLIRAEVVRRGRPDMPKISAEVMKEIANRSWPGNVRELRNMIQRAFDLGGARAPTSATFTLALQLHAPAEDSDERTAQTEPVERNNAAQEIAPDVLLQEIRYDELAVLLKALATTRSRVTKQYSRASAAAWLKGADRSSTNVFDRWFMRVWSELTATYRSRARANWPEEMNYLDALGIGV